MTTQTMAAPAPAMATGGRGRWLGLAMLSLGVSMIIVDATIVNVAIPSIIKDLGLDSTSAEWINAIYTLVFAALLVTLGRMGDVLGRRAMYLAGLVIFILASMVAGLSTSGEMLIAARLVQGIGGAMILPSTQSILNANFQGRDRAIAFGIWGAVIGGMAAIGPLLGGWLTTNLSWNWAFYINLPVGILAILGTLRYIGESRDEHTKLGFDLPGFILITVGLVGVVFGLIEGRTYGWWAPNPNHPFTVLGWTWPSTTISIVPVTIGHRRRLAPALRRRRDPAPARRQVLPVRLLAVGLPRLPLRQPRRHDRQPRRVRAAVRPAALPAGRASATTPSRPGSSSWPSPSASFFAAPLSATLARRFGPRRAVTLGMALEAVGIFFTTLLDQPVDLRASCSPSRSSCTASASASRRRSSRASSSPTSRPSGRASRPGRTRRCARWAPPWAWRSWGPSSSPRS